MLCCADFEFKQIFDHSHCRVHRSNRKLVKLEWFLCSTALEEGLAQKRKPSSEQIKAVGPKRAKKGLAFESESDISEEDSQDNKSSD